MKNTRFNQEDLHKIEGEFTAIKGHLNRLRDLMLEANLRHTKERFYDSRLRRVTDGLPSRLHALEELLWDEVQRHHFQAVSRVSAEGGTFEVRS